MSFFAILIVSLIFIFLAFGALLLHVIFKRKIHIWLPAYCLQVVSKISKADISVQPIHILFCFVDHYEPGWNKADLNLERKRVEGWLDKYPKFAREFVDADGFHPRHTWFYPPHYFREEHMDPFPDTSETLRNKILNCIDLYSQYGIFRTQENGIPQIKYAFIHGDWALDNSRNGYCGINDEISILQETGC